MFWLLLFVVRRESLVDCYVFVVRNLLIIACWVLGVVAGCLWFVGVCLALFVFCCLVFVICLLFVVCLFVCLFV